MLCPDLEEKLFDLLDGRLSAADELRAHAHLEACPACRQRAASWRQALPIMREAVPPAPDFRRTRRMEVALLEELARPTPAARPPARPRWWWAGAAAAAMIALAAGYALRRTSGSTPLAQLASGPVSVEGAPLATGRPLPVGRTVDVGAGGLLAAELARHSMVRASGPARFALLRADTSVRIRLDAGELEAQVTPRWPGEEFVVELRHGRVEVRGTRFVVGYAGAGSFVRVAEGRVAVIGLDGGLDLVPAGQTRWLAPQTVALEVPPAPPPPAEAPPAADTCAQLQRSCAAAVARTRAALRASDGSRAIAASAAEGVAVGGCGLAAANECLDELHYLRAEALRMAGRLPAAVAAYHALDRRSAPASTRQNALFAAAELERRLGQARAARRDYERALAVPGAPGLREEALLGVMDTAAEAGDSQAAVTAARRYLVTYPDGHGAARARALLDHHP